VFCILIYTRQKKQVDQLYLQLQSLLKVETVLNNAIQQQSAIQKKIDQLASDVLQRDMYQNTDDRHQAAIKSARQGMGLFEIIQRHGLSSDEAELIISLHAPAKHDGDVSIKNANLNNTTVLDVI
jgi:uncharacterized protein YjcR